MLQPRRAFTIMELVIVIAIVTVLLVVMQDIFQTRNKDFFYGQVCVNNLYGQMNNFVQSAITAKGLYQSGNIVFPSKYIIDVDVPTNTVSLQYTSGGNNYTYASYMLSGGTPVNFDCYTNAYVMTLSGTSFTTTINQGLEITDQLRTFMMTQSGDINIFSGQIAINQCPRTDMTICQEMGKITIDSRTQFIEKQLCLSPSSGTTCTTRSQ